MTLTAEWYRLHIGDLPRGVVVADARPTAAPLWDGPIASILEELADRLPPARHPEVVFLGDRVRYPLARVLRGVGSTHDAAAGEPVDVKAGQGKYPVAGPALREVQLGPTRPVLLLLAGPTIDLDDWAVPEVSRHTLVYRLFGGERVAPAAFTELDPTADLTAVVEHLRDPIRSVRIGDETVLVLDWDNEAYRWERGRLTADSPTAPDVRVQLCRLTNASPTAVVVRASGAESRAPLHGPGPPGGTAAVPLRPAEEVVIGVWERHLPFHCRECGRDHPPGRVNCWSPAEGRGLFPSLCGVPTPVYVVSETGGQWSAVPIPRGIVLVRDDFVLVHRAGEAPVYAVREGRWQARYDEPGHFIPAGANRFVLRA